MSFILPDLVIESVLREGFADLKANPERINDVFGDLLNTAYLSKYGSAELTRIKNEIQKNDWSFVHSFSEVHKRVPCVSIQLLTDVEAKNVTYLEDNTGFIGEEITDIDELADLVKITNIMPTSYDPKTGIVKVPDSVDLTEAYPNLVFEDFEGGEFPITGAIIETDGKKQFGVKPGSDVKITGIGLIKSGVSEKCYNTFGVHTNVQIMLGVHNKEALMTKYMYILVKYFLLSRKKDLIRRCFITSTFQGSDFTRNLETEGDILFHRFLTISGKVEDTWQGTEDFGTLDRIIIDT